MKRTQTTTTKEYDKDGNLVSEVTETVEEEDGGYIYPQHHAYPLPWWPTVDKPVTITQGIVPQKLAGPVALGLTLRFWPFYKKL